MDNGMRLFKRRFNEVSFGTKSVLHIIFIVYALACILPVVLVFMISVTDEMTTLKNGYSLFPEKFDFISYRYLFSDINTIARAYGITIVVAITGTVLNLLITAAYSYPLSRNTFHFKGFFTVLILIPMLIGGGMVPFYIVYVNVLQVKNSLLALILPGLFGGFNAFVVRTYLKANDLTSMLEAAYLDGASETRIFFAIVMPLSKPVLATIAFFSFLGYWNDWYNCLLFIDNTKMYNIQYVMMRALREAEYLRNNLKTIGYLREELNKLPSENIRMAMAVVGMGPILIAYPFFQKYFIKGMVIGAIKG